MYRYSLFLFDLFQDQKVSSTFEDTIDSADRRQCVRHAPPSNKRVPLKTKYFLNCEQKHISSNKQREERREKRWDWKSYITMNSQSNSTNFFGLLIGIDNFSFHSFTGIIVCSEKFDSKVWNLSEIQKMRQFSKTRSQHFKMKWRVVNGTLIFFLRSILEKVENEAWDTKMTPFLLKNKRLCSRCDKVLLFMISGRRKVSYLQVSRQIVVGHCLSVVWDFVWI